MAESAGSMGRAEAGADLGVVTMLAVGVVPVEVDVEVAVGIALAVVPVAVGIGVGVGVGVGIALGVAVGIAVVAFASRALASIGAGAPLPPIALPRAPAPMQRTAPTAQSRLRAGVAPTGGADRAPLATGVAVELPGENDGPGST